MQADWQDFLKNQGAVIEQGHVIHYGQPGDELTHTQTGTILIDRSHCGLICFSGDDARSFLQKQLSCDVEDVSYHTAQYGSYCTPKGRMLATFILWRQDDVFYMQLPESLVASMIKRLSMFVMRAKVTVADATGQFVRFGLAGQQAQTLTAEYTGAVVNADAADCLQVIHHEQAHIICHQADQFEFFVPAEAAQALWKQFSQQAQPAGIHCWDWRNIQAGIPTILPATQEQFIPQMVNLEAIGGVSFKKGCYPGQEIVARTQHIGKIKRRMYRAHLATDSAKQVIAPGDDLFGNALPDQSCGKLVNVAPAPGGGFDVLAVIQVSSLEAGDIYCQSVNGAQLEILPLPYAVD